MRAFLEQYGIAIFVILIIGIMTLMASGVGVTVEGLLKDEIKRFTDKSVSENQKVLNGTVDEDDQLVIEDIVIDYGLPVQLNLPKVGTAKVSSEKSSANYGTLTFSGDNTISDWSVIYTPNQILSGIDTVKLVLEDDTEYTFNVIPATTMYYETDFSNNVFKLTTTGEDWTIVNEGQSANPQQVCEKVGTNKPYGYDSAYENVSKLSNGSSLFIEGQGVKLNNSSTNYSYIQFEFTGTGFDLISRTGINQGGLRVEIFSDAEETNLIKSITVLNKGEVELYQIPVVSVNNLEHGKYYVKIHINAAYTNNTYPQLSRGGEFYFDAIRIYDSAKGNNIAEEAYKADGEAYPEFNEVRKLLLDAAALSGTDIIQGAVFVDGIGNTPSISDYAANGPNNESYLNKGQAISFRISNTDYKNIEKLALGIKSLNGQNTSVSISTLGESGKTVTTKSATDMFYDITDCIAFEDDGTSKIIVIKNTGSELVSITDLKITYKSTPSGSTTFVTSVEDANKVINALN